MKLQYNSNLAQPTDQVFENAKHWRIEMSLRTSSEGKWVMIALSGLNDRPPELSKLQGPYETQAQAIAARSAIAAQLLSKGFKALEDSCIWNLQAQKALNDVRESHRHNPVDTTFFPYQVLPDPISADAKQRSASSEETQDTTTPLSVVTDTSEVTDALDNDEQ